jgi:hypothetical protein
MTDEEFRALVLEAFKLQPTGDYHYPFAPNQLRHLVARAVEAEREAILAVIEAYKVPVGNSAAGEMACEWTMDALRDLRDAIRARGSNGTAA